MNPSVPSAPSQDPIGAFLVRQRPDVVLGTGTGPLNPVTAGEKLTDLAEIARILKSCLVEENGEDDDLVVELLMLESMLAGNDVKSDELLAQLGALGDEVREGIMPEGQVNIAALRQRTKRLQAHLGGAASRLSAALMLFLTGLPVFASSAQAATDDAGYAAANAPVVRVIDAASGQGMPGVQIKTMEERLLGVTDGSGQATLADGYMETEIIGLEKEGYEMYLLDRSQLSSRNIVSMKPLSGAVAAKPNGPKPNVPSVRTPTAPPRVAHTTPHVTAPKAPVKPLVLAPKAPTKPAIAAPKAPTKPAAVQAQKPVAPVIRLPIRPRPTAAAALNARVAAKPVVPGMATPSGAAPDMKLPTRPKATAAVELDLRDPMATPARPRLPVLARAPRAAAHHAASHVSVPRRVPRMRTHHVAQLPAGGTYYRVRPGDSLSKIAQRRFGSAKRWPELFAANRDRVSNPAFIRAGQTLLMPAMASGGGATYVVKPGDCLFTIAGAQMGNASKWRSLWAANRGKIRDARFIYPGQTLTLPLA